MSDEQLSDSRDIPALLHRTSVDQTGFCMRTTSYYEGKDSDETEQEKDLIRDTSHFLSTTSGSNVPSIVEGSIPSKDDIRDSQESSEPEEEQELSVASHLKSKPCDIIVTLMNNQELQVHCPYGHQTTAKELKELTLKALKIPEQHHNLFSIWVTSPSLRLPAKDHYYPIKMIKLWPDLLESYTDKVNASFCALYLKMISLELPRSKEDEFPAIYLRKDPMTHPGMETGLVEENTLLLLFIELTDEIVHSECLVDYDDAVFMATIHLFLNFGEIATRKDLSNSHGSQQPPHLIEQIRWKAWEKEVFDMYQRLLEHFKSISSAEIMADYLSMGRGYATYGGVKFIAMLEPRNKGTLLRERRAKKIILSVNFDGIHVIDLKKHTLELSLPFHAFRARGFVTYEDDYCLSVVYNINGDPLTNSTVGDEPDNNGADDSAQHEENDLTETSIESDLVPIKLFTHYNEEENNTSASFSSEENKNSLQENEQEEIIWTKQSVSMIEAIETYRHIHLEENALSKQRESIKGSIFTKSVEGQTARDPRLRRAVQSAYNTLHRRMAQMTVGRLRRSSRQTNSSHDL